MNTSHNNAQANKAITRALLLLNQLKGNKGA